MSQSEEQKPPAPVRKQTPRVPANLLYDRILPIVLVVTAIVLVIVLVLVVLGAGQSY